MGALSEGRTRGWRRRESRSVVRDRWSSSQGYRRLKLLVSYSSVLCFSRLKVRTHMRRQISHRLVDMHIGDLLFGSELGRWLLVVRRETIPPCAVILKRHYPACCLTLARKRDGSFAAQFERRGELGTADRTQAGGTDTAGVVEARTVFCVSYPSSASSTRRRNPSRWKPTDTDSQEAAPPRRGRRAGERDPPG